MQKCHFRGTDDSHGYQTFTLCVSNEVTSHELWVSGLTYFSRSLRSKFEISLPGGTFCYYLTERAVSWCNDVYSSYLLCACQIQSDPIPKCGHQGRYSKMPIGWIRIIWIISYVLPHTRLYQSLWFLWYSRISTCFFKARRFAMALVCYCRTFGHGF